MDTPALFLSAGDHSGDIAAARLVTALRGRLPDLRVVGLGAERLRRLGQEQFVAGSELSVLGFWEVARRYGFFRRLMDRCVESIRTLRPGGIVLVDYPGFNLRLAARVRELGIPIVYYITPQVWAWGAGRVKQIRELVDRVLVILPFESEFFARNGIESEFVGHYLLEDIPAEYVASPVPDNGPLALLPGSRPQEIQRMLPLMLDVGAQNYKRTGVPAVVAGISGAFDYQAEMARHDCNGVSLVCDDSRRVIFEASQVVAASGTATLETGIIGRPMVVVYKTGFITYQIARRLIKLDRIALVNLVLGRKTVTELIQGDATPSRVLAELERYTGDLAFAGATVAELNRVPGLLGGRGSSERAAERILELLTREGRRRE